MLIPMGGRYVANTGINRLATTELIADSSQNSSFTSGSFTAQTGANRCAVLFVCTSTRDPSPSSITATLGATAMTLVGRVNLAGTFKAEIAIFRLLDASIPAGANALSVDFGTACDACWAFMVEFEGVSQITPFGTTIGGALTSRTVNITNASSYALFCGNGRSGTAYPISATTGTMLGTSDGGIASSIGAGMTEYIPGVTGDATETFSWSGTVQSATIGVEMFEA